MRKTYILDTNVLLHDPSSLTHFTDNNVIIPIEVIGEIDHFKRESSDRGQNARQVSRLLDSLRNGQSLAEGINLPDDVFLRVHWDSESSLTPTEGSADAQILRIAHRLRDQQPETPVIIVSKDINLRIRADAMGLRAEDYETDRVVLDRATTSHPELVLDPEAFDQLAARQHAAVPTGAKLLPNQYVMLRCASTGKT
ncbi:MAG: PIN domain-containing protein, partial [Phycisphaerae bacterium]